MSRKFVFALCLSFAISAVSPIKTYAASSYSSTQNKSAIELKKSVEDVVSLLKEVLDERYALVEEEVKDLVRDKCYDYELTMDSLYDQPNPFKDGDYIRYLAAYMSCKKYAKEENLSIMQLREIPFISFSYKEEEAAEYVPTLIDEYLQDPYVLDEYIKVSGNKYIFSEVEVPVYERQENGHYKETGKVQIITPEKKNVKYAKVTLNVIKPEDVFGYLNIDENKVSDDYEKRVAKIKKVTSNEAIRESILVNLPVEGVLTPILSEEYDKLFSDLDEVRQLVVSTALSIEAQVPYEWGGKASFPGFDNKWWTYNEENGLQHGLDCSGFVQWTFMTAGFPSEFTDRLHSTKDILSSGIKQITKEDLKPGDIGVTNRPDGQINHTGIYVGDDKWVHCSSSKKTVVVGEVDFNTFFSPYEDETNIDKSAAFAYLGALEDGGDNIINTNNIRKYIDTYKSIYYTHSYNEEEVLLLAKLIAHESRGEGINGWIAVGEVVLNRVKSEAFPNTINEVIYQDGQFSEVYELEDVTPTKEMITVAQMVLSEKLGVLCNSDVLYFRNPAITDGLLPTDKVDFGDHKWFTSINNHAFYLG